MIFKIITLKKIDSNFHLTATHKKTLLIVFPIFHPCPVNSRPPLAYLPYQRIDSAFVSISFLFVNQSKNPEASSGRLRTSFSICQDSSWRRIPTRMRPHVSTVARKAFTLIIIFVLLRTPAPIYHCHTHTGVEE